MINKEQAIQALKKFALDHYDKGFDVFVECYEDAEWSELFDESGSYTAALKSMKEAASVFADRQADARYHESMG